VLADARAGPSADDLARFVDVAAAREGETRCDHRHNGRVAARTEPGWRCAYARYREAHIPLSSANQGVNMSRPFVSAGAVPLEVHPAEVVPAAQALPARAARATAAHSLRRFAGRVSALLADDGVSARFAAERGRDAGLLHRVERRRRP
jgi:hypothetical protein